MKKIVLILAVIGSLGVANAQTEQGGWVIGASSNLGYSSTNFAGSDNATNFNVDGRAGYFIIDNLSLGLLLEFSRSSQGDISLTTTQIGPWARCYPGGRFFLGASFSASSTTADSGSGEVKANGGNLMFEGGYPVFLGDNVAVEPALNYSIGTGDFDESSTFGAAVGFTLYF